jgi:hypothetical protein
MGSVPVMRWLLIVNVVGLLAAGAYGGAVASATRVPWWAFAAAALFLIALALPLIAEYRSVGHGFGKIEQSFLAQTRKPYFPNAAPEIFAPNAEPEPVWQEYRPPVKSVLALTIVAGALLTVDVALYVSTLPPPGTDTGKISNY